MSNDLSGAANAASGRSADSASASAPTSEQLLDSVTEGLASALSNAAEMDVRRPGLHFAETHGASAVSSHSPQRTRESATAALKISNSFCGSHRSAHSVATVKSLDSTIADGQARVHASSIGRYVRFNVGGTLFFTTVDTVCKRDTMLRAMFTGDLAVQVDSDGFILIDRSGKHFAKLLNFLRDGAVPFPDSVEESSELLVEAKYYLFDELTVQLDDHIEQIKKDNLTVCRMPMVTSVDEFQRVLSGTRKPIIRLIFNRFNNKYSYTGTSDDNLLKNLELFDRLATRFMDRVVFVKDIVGGSDICTWLFYGHGKRQAEISCDAIVYATDNKHIKIDFPEAKIYEECLNIMLFEERYLDAEKAAAAQNRAAILSRWKNRIGIGNLVTSDDDN